jgi:tetratricopeptide (TPR) repeat protein
MTESFARLGRALGGRYTIERELGAGGMATVYLAHDVRHDRKVAVKVLKPELAVVLGAERFLNEIKVTANLQHPHILPLHDSGEADSFLYYVMPYVEGETLREKLNREKQLAIEEAIAITKAVGQALDYAHRRNVIHRDIKPENILLQDGQPVVADFGIALAVKAAGGARLTETGLSLGTPQYMSPEQATGDRELDGRSDVYSLACVLYEMLSGEPPHTGPTVQAVITKVVTDRPREITELRDTVPPHVAAAVHKALAKLPADRFGSSTAFGEALQSETLVSRRGAKRIPRVRQGMAVVAVLATVGLLWMLWPRGPAAPVELTVVVDHLVDRTDAESLRSIGSLAVEVISEGIQRSGVANVVSAPRALRVGEQVRSDGTAEDVQAQLAARTDATTVIHGAYYSVGDSVEFRVVITDARTGEMLNTVQPFRAHSESVDGMLRLTQARVVGALAAVVDPLTWRWFRSLASLPKDVEVFRLWREAEVAYLLQGRLGDALQRLHAAWDRDSTFLVLLGRLALVYSAAGRYAEADSVVGIAEAFEGEMGPLELAHVRMIRASLRGDIREQMRWADELATLSGWDVSPAGIALRMNRPTAAIRYLNLDQPDLSTGSRSWWSLGATAYHLLGRYDDELDRARAARRVHPRNIRLLRDEARALAALGRVDELRDLMERNRTLPSRGSMSYAQVVIETALELKAHGHSNAGQEILESWIDQESPSEDSDWAAWRDFAEAQYYAGYLWEAEEHFAELQERRPDDVDVAGFLGAIAARTKRAADAGQFAERLKNPPPYTRGRNTVWRARMVALQGERELAVRLLEQAYSEGSGLGIWLHRDFDLATLRGYPAYEEFARLRD